MLLGRVLPLITGGLTYGQMFTSGGEGVGQRLGAAVYLLDEGLWQECFAVLDGMPIDGLPPTTLNALDLLRDVYPFSG